MVAFSPPRGFALARAPWRALALALVLPLTGCGSSAVSAAKSGDQRALAASLRARIDDGSLSRSEAARIATAVAEREIEVADGEAGAHRIRELRACARDLESALEDREKKADAAGVEAAWSRALYADMSASEARRYAKSTDPRLRAIAPLGLVREEDADARRTAFVDKQVEARRAAMRAALHARDRADVPTLAEAARLDPDPIVRTDAIRVLATIGGAEVAARLRDLWTHGDEGVRGDIAVAWSKPALYPHGGEEALRTLVGSQRGPGAIEAASAVLRTKAGGEPGAAPSAELRAMSVAMLARTIEKDARRGRLHALATAPVSAAGELGPIVSAVRAAAKEDDLEVRVTALSRLVEHPLDRAAAIAELEQIAGRDQGRQSRRALFALATAGHLRIQAWLERDLGSPEPEARVSALLSLIALERAPRGATLLADQDPSVRTRASCLLIGAAHRR